MKDIYTPEDWQVKVKPENDRLEDASPLPGVYSMLIFRGVYATIANIWKLIYLKEWEIRGPLDEEKANVTLGHHVLVHIRIMPHHPFFKFQIFARNE